MATKEHSSQHIHKNGLAKVENDKPVEHTILLHPQELKNSFSSNESLDKSSSNKNRIKNLGMTIKLIPQVAGRKKKDILASMKNKEPKFVPYEPYKAAVRPIVPPKKTNYHLGGKKSTKDFPGIITARKSVILDGDRVVNEDDKNKSSKVTEVDWEAKYKALESEIQTLKEENEQLENQLKFQVQVNGELKNLLVAAVGEDIQTKVHILTEDKLHLAQALLKSAESLTTHQEQTEWLAGQCEVWRSKFLASSVMVEELARWKASLCQKVNEAHEVLKKILEEGKQIRDSIVKTYRNLCLLRDNFDLHNKKNNMTSCNVIAVAAENFKLSEVLLIELLGSNKKSESSQTSHLEHLKKTPAEKSAEHVLANPSLLQLIKEPDAACNAVVGAAVTLSGQLYLKSHPPKIECCRQCTGEIKLV